MPDRTDWKVSPIVKVSNHEWEAREGLSVDSIRLGGVAIEVGAPLMLKPGQRIVIEWHGGSEASIAFHIPD